jgi:hypothetical protein
MRLEHHSARTTTRLGVRLGETLHRSPSGGAQEEIRGYSWAGKKCGTYVAAHRNSTGAEHTARRPWIFFGCVVSHGGEWSHASHPLLHSDHLPIIGHPRPYGLNGLSGA